MKSSSKSQILVKGFPFFSEIFFVRNHLPVPQIDLNDYTLEIEGFGLKSPKTLSVEDIKTKFPKHSVTATIMCSGNRRNEMNKVLKYSTI